MNIDINNPYVGLRPFHAEESLLFFGRDEQTLELLQRLHDHHFVAVVGSSGCGKSSLLRAGLIPSLKGGYLVDDSDQWLISVMKPGQSPLFNLAESILKEINPKAKPDEISELVKKIKEEGIDAILDIIRPLREKKHTNFFLLVDQFEELFRFSMEKENASRKDEAIDFVNIILELSTQTIIPFYVVFTMRSDFIGDCTQYHGLPEAMNKSQYLVPRLNRRQLKLVIEGPARLYGGNFNTVLTSKLLNKLRQIKDELPLLQHILMRIWDHEDETNKSGELDIEDYNNVGGLEKGLSNHAEEAADGMTKREKSISKEMFKALTAIDENGRKIRRPLLLSNLKELTGASYVELEEVIDHFVRDKRSFLIVEKAGDTRDKVIDISHESLIRQWETLGKWVDEEQESASYYLQLAEATRLSKLKKKDYLTGSELTIALDWKNKFNPTPVWANRYKTGFQDCLAYLENSEIEFNRVTLREKRRKRLKKITLGAIVGLVGLVAAMFISSGIQEGIRNKAYSLFIDGSEIRTVDPTIALDSMVKAINDYPGLHPKFYDIAKETYYNNEQYTTILEGTPGAKTPIVFDQSGKGNYYKSGKKKYVLEVLNGLTGEYIKKEGYKSSIELPKEASTTITLPLDAGYIVGFEDGMLAHYRTNGELKQTFNSEITSQVKSVIFGKNNISFLVIYDNGTIILRNLINDKIGYQKKFEARVLNAIFSPDGKRLLCHLANNTIQIIELDSKIIFTIKGENNDVASTIFSPNEKQVLLGYQDGLIEAYDLKGQFIGEIIKFKDGIERINISTDRSKILITTKNSWVLLDESYEIRLDDKVFGVFKGGTLGGFFLDKDQTLALYYSEYYDRENITLLYDIDGEKIGEKIRRKTNGLKFSEFSNLGPLRVEIHEKQYGELFDSKGQKLAEVEEVYGNTKTTFSSDGSKIINYSTDELVVYSINDATSYEILRRPNRGYITDAIQQKNKLVIAWSENNGRSSLIFLKENNHNYVEEPEFRIDISGLIMRQTNTYDYFAIGTKLRFSPDGKHLFIGFNYGILASLNLDTLLLDKYYEGHHTSNITGIEFSKNGNFYYTSSLDGTIKQWHIKGSGPSRTFTGNTSPINFIKLLPDDNHFISSSIDGNVKLWDRNGQLFKEYNGHNDEAITSISISEDGNIITASEDGAINSWTKHNDRYLFFERLNNFTLGSISSITATKDSIIKVVFKNGGSKSLIMETNGVYSSSDDSLYIGNNDLYKNNLEIEDLRNSTYVSPKGSRYFMIKNDSAVLKHINGDLIKNFGKFDQEISAITFSKDEKNMFAARKDGALIMFDSLDIGPRIIEKKINESEINRDNEINLISVSNDKSIAVLSFKNDSIAYKLDISNSKNNIDRKRLLGLSSVVTSHDISEDSKFIIAGSSNGDALIWSIENHREPISILKSDDKSGTNSITSIKFSPNGKYAFTGFANGKGLLWLIKYDDEMLPKSEVVQRFELNSIKYKYQLGKIIKAEFSLDESSIIIGSEHGTIGVHKIDAKEPFNNLIENDDGSD